jgi:gluconokinase
VPSVTDPQAVIVMGVSGTGKTTIGEGIAAAMGWRFAEGDDFHSAANKAKMAAGQPLSDEDRWPWLRIIADWIDEQSAAGRSSVVTCSALRRTYRDLLRDNRSGVRFCELLAPEELIADRLGHRRGHFMPAGLLGSQLAILEPLQPDEPGVVVSVDGTPDEIVADALHQLGLTART